MNQYYLMAQLPSLDGVGETNPLPITAETFYELCGRFLGKKAVKAMQGLSLVPERDASPVGYALLDTWNQAERKLRLALGAVRAEKMKKPFDVGEDPLPAELLQTAQTAVDMSDPMAAEQYLSQYRMACLESLRPRDAFCEDAVFYYGLKLQLLLRMRHFDVNKGQAAYRNIYDSILRGGSQESES